MLVFILSFIVFTITNTFFADIQISILSFIICLLLLIIFAVFKRGYKFFSMLKYILILFWSFVVSLSAIMIKDYRYSSELVHNFINSSSRAESRDPLKRFLHFSRNDSREKSQLKSWTDKENNNLDTWNTFSYFIWTWIILDTYSFGKYILENNFGEQYILNTQNKYQIWDILRLVWYVSDLNLFANKASLSWLWNRSFDYDKWLIMKGYRGNIYEGNSIVLNDGFRLQTSSMTPEWHEEQEVWFISNIKKSLQSKIISTYWEGRNAWLILWMLIWDKSQIPKSDYQQFIDSGLVHLIAVSGGNIIMLTIFLSFILFFLPFYFRNFILLCSIILYSLVCWMDSSVLRAVLFAGLGVMALFVGRETNFWRSVYIAFVSTLLINPYFLLYDLWFLLSFGAIIGIRIFTKEKNIEEKKEIPVVKLNPAITRQTSGMTVKKRFLTAFEMTVKRIYNSYIKPSIGANIWIFPVVIFFMWKLNIVGFVSNLFVLPIVPFVMIYGFVSMFLYSLLPRRGRVYIQDLLINYIYKVSQIWSDYWIYLLVDDYKIKYLILILFVIWLIIYMVQNKIIILCNNCDSKKSIVSIKHNRKKSNYLTKK